MCDVGNCTECSTNNTCSVCFQGFTASQGSCVECEVGGCLMCSSPNVCSQCEFGSPANGKCGGSYLCTATAGFDGPTGLGTPNGVSAF